VQKLLVNYVYFNGKHYQTEYTRTLLIACFSGERKNYRVHETIL